MLPWQRFSAWRLAHSMWHCAPEALSPAQQQRLAPQLARQLRLEQAVVDEANRQAPDLPHRLVQTVSETLGDALRQAGFSAAECDAAIRHHALMEWQLAQIAAQATPPGDDEVAAWYRRHAAQFCRPEQRLTRHLLITEEEREPGAARARLQALHRQVQQGRATFAALAERHSHCPTALEGGLLGWVSRGLLFAPLEQTLFTLAPGALSDPVASDIGWHLLLCEAIRPEAPLAPALALAKVHDHLWRQRQRERQRQWLAALEADAV